MNIHIGEYRFQHEHVSVRWAGATHAGLVRRINEDSVFASFPVFLVADGMGGHAAGDVASALAVEAFRHLKGRSLASVDDVEASVERAFTVVEAAASGVQEGGTTLAGSVLVDIDGVAHWYVVNVGDSRTYCLHGGVFEQISHDHSLVQELVDAGSIPANDARRHPKRNVITRAIGAGGGSKPDAWLFPAERGQRLLVCTDGLSGEVPDATIANILRSVPSPAAAAGELIDAALKAGAPDNVSVIVLDVDAVSHGDDGMHDTASVPGDDTVPRRRP